MFLLALETALKSGLNAARTKLQNQCTDIVRAYRSSGAYGAQGQVQLPDSLQLLPLYTVRRGSIGLSFQTPSPTTF